MPGSHVADAVRSAACEHLEIAVRGGGHNVAGGPPSNGLMIDLSLMKGIQVDPQRGRRAQGGVMWREFNRETQVFGLATTGGVVASRNRSSHARWRVGLVMGKHGLAVDNLRSADLVLADGRWLRRGPGQSGPVLGDARRRRQLRRRDIVRVPGPPGGHGPTAAWSPIPSAVPARCSASTASSPRRPPTSSPSYIEPVRRPGRARNEAWSPWPPATAATPRARRPT